MALDAGGAGRGDGGVGAVNAEDDGDVPAGGIDHEARHGERADPADAAGVEDFVLILEGFDAADAAADDHAAAVAVGFFEVDAGIVDGADGGGDAELAEAIHSLGMKPLRR